MPKSTKTKTPKPTADDAPPKATIPVQPKGKLGTVVALLRRDDGASVPEMMEATGWQAHSVRGALAGALKTKLKLEIASSKVEGGERRYRITEAAHDAG